jgi:hypothetical protein
MLTCYMDTTGVQLECIHVGREWEYNPITSTYSKNTRTVIILNPELRALFMELEINCD